MPSTRFGQCALCLLACLGKPVHCGVPAPESRSSPSRPAFLVGCLGFAGAAWSKFLLAPVVGAGLVALAVVVLARPRVAGLTRRSASALLLGTCLLAAVPYIDSFITYGIPLWPLDLG